MLGRAVLGLIVVLGLIAFVSQHRVAFANNTLRERLSQLPTQTVSTSAVQPQRLATPRAQQPAATVATSAPSPPPSPPPPPLPSPPPKDNCPGRRRPYHVLLTAASGIYQEWQTRIAYHHYLKLKAANPCSDIGNFTRLLNTPNARPDGLMDEIPTVLVSQLNPGRCDECDHAFIVMNRPWGLRQFVSHPAFAHIEEEYIFIVETDHLLLRPLPNQATEASPVGFGFYYMTYRYAPPSSPPLATCHALLILPWCRVPHPPHPLLVPRVRYDPPKLKPVVQKYHDPEGVDPVGPSPVIIHKKMLAKVVDPWWQLCIQLKRDPQADRAFGWVLEMWGWALATARMGIRHTMEPKLQAEPGGPGINNLAEYYIYHYTFDLDMQATSPSCRLLQACEKWFWSKRRFMGNYPPRLTPPPHNAARSSHTFAKMMNEGMDSVQPWAPARRQ